MYNKVLIFVIIVIFLVISCDIIDQNHNDPPSSVLFDQEPQVSIVSNTQVLITWDTEENIGGEIKYGTKFDELVNSVPFNTSSDVQYISFDNLLPNTNYFFSLFFNPDDEYLPSDPMSFQTLNIDDLIVTDLANYQPRIISALSGHSAMRDSIFLSDRSSTENRTLTAKFIEEELSAFGFTVKRHNYSGPDYSSIKGTNVYCTIPATVETNDYIVIGAHYDSVVGSPGANDNASGVALVLTITGEVLEMPDRNKNVIIVFFDQEEIGLWGSHYFADSLYESGTEINSAHTVDQIAWDEDGDRAIELALPTKTLEFLYRASNNETIQKSIYIIDARSSDHSSFRRLDIPAIGITEEYRNGDTTPYRHSPEDTYETVNFEYLASSTHLVVYALKVLLSQ